MAYRQSTFRRLWNLSFTLLPKACAAPESLSRGSLGHEIWWASATEMDWLALKSSAINPSSQINFQSAYQSIALWQALGWDITKNVIPALWGPTIEEHTTVADIHMEMPVDRRHSNGTKVIIGMEHSLKEFAKANFEGLWGDLTQSWKVHTEWRQFCLQIPKL